MPLFDRIANVFRAEKLERALDEELAFHVAERTDELVAAGMTERDARREALRRFGNYTAQKEKTRDMDIARTLEAFVANIKYGLRQLRLSPGFTTVAVLSLALGIGANSAIFQIVDAIRLRGLPVHNPSQLVLIDAVPEFFTSGWHAARNRAYTWAQIEEIRRLQQAFSDVLVFGTQRFNLSRGGESRFAEGLFVSSNYFDVLGVKPFLGTSFSGPDKSDCGDAGAVLSYAFWQREFGGSVSAIGRTVSLDGHQFPVVGVAPREFFGLEPGYRFDVAVPLCADTIMRTGPKDAKGRMEIKDAWWLTAIGRLKPGWSVEKASAHLLEISPAVFRESVPPSYRADAQKKYKENKLKATAASAGVSSLRRQYENPLWILLATTALVLLIACANLANLLLARASTREREMGVRQALGASRLRLIGQLLSESLLLAFFGAVLGAVLAQVLSRALITFLDSGRNTIVLGGADWRVYAFTAALALATCVLFGLAPAIRASRTAPANAMRGGRGSSAGAERNGLRRVLVVSQISLSLVLLVGALLFGRTLRNLISVDNGINSAGVLVASVDTKLPKLQPERRRILYEQIQERVAAQPGVVSVAPVWLSPFGGSMWNQSVTPEGKDNSAKDTVWMNLVGPGYFRTMETPLVAGRDFGPHDDQSAPRIAIVNQTFARKLFDGRNPVGRTFRVEGSADKADKVFQIVGLVKDTKYSGLREEFRPIAFFPLNQAEEMPGDISFMVRSRGPASQAIAAVRQQMADINRELLVEFRMLDVQIQQSILRERLMAHLSGGFGLIAGLLSALGLYGVMSYMVARRRREIGVRMAMGATKAAVLALVFKEAGKLIAVGLAIGVAGSYAVSRYAESLLFGLKPNDALTLAAACVLLLGTALAATMLPARRAVALDPAVTLRED
jgi:putative ABC transport system permease protein